MACSQRISECLTAIVDKLVASGGFTEREAFLTLEPQKIEYLGGCYAAVTPNRINIDAGAVSGGGDEVMLVDLGVMIRLWANISLDEASRDTEALTSSLGIYDKVECVIKALQLYAYCDNDGFGFAEPMRLLSTETSRRDPTRPEWLYVDMSWQVQFLIDYNQ